TAAAVGRLEVDLLDRVLADVADVEVAGQAVEAEAPRVAQAERPDLVPDVRVVHERIGRRDDRAGRVDVEAEDLAEQRVPTLGVARRIPGRPAVAETDVEVAVRSEGEAAAVVVAE